MIDLSSERTYAGGPVAASLTSAKITCSGYDAKKV